MNDLGVILLTNRGFTVVDSDLFESLNQFNWGLDNHGYVRRFPSGSNNRNPVWIHRVVNQTPLGSKTDHKNGFQIDNTRRNLRVATFATNGANRKKQSVPSTSKYKGVTYCKNTTSKIWKAQIRVNGKYIYLGMFDSEKEAALAYNKSATLHFGEFALLNKV